MNPLTAEWIAKAEADYEGAVDLRRRRKNPLPDLVCFHCQQCAEKYPKALLQESGIAFPKTHVLTDLLTLTVTVCASLRSLQPQLTVLENYAVRFRYPGMDSTLTQAIDALQAVRAVRRLVRAELGLS